MTVNELKQYIEQGNEMEFVHDNKRYSITYGEIDGKEVISFCEFNKETTEVKTIDVLLEVKRDNRTVKEMIESLDEEHTWIF